MNFIDASIYTIAIGSVVFFSAQFVFGLVKRHRSKPQVVPQSEPGFVPNPVGFSEATIEEADLVEWHQRYVALHWAQLPTDNVVRFERKIPKTVDLQDLDSFELRRKCQENGIKWRNANGKHRHMSKPQMIAALRMSA